MTMASLQAITPDDIMNQGEEESTITNQWKDQQDSVLVLQSLQYLDVVTLIQKKSVSKQWKELCTKTINDKCVEKQKSFQSKQELRDAVNKYSPGIYDGICNSIDVESIASTFGYPIGKWDVSNISDLSEIFDYKPHFNEPIGSWDVSNVTNMYCMFFNAFSFNQDLSKWNVSNVTDMTGMFFAARSFNQDISSWDVSKVTDMGYMFKGAKYFNQDLSNWDVSNITRFTGMFCCCPVDEEQSPLFT